MVRGQIIVHRIRKVLRSRFAGAAGLLLAVLTVNILSVSCGSTELELIPAESAPYGGEDAGSREETEELSGDRTAQYGEESMDTEKPPDSAEIYVHVCGAVAEPGVYLLEAGARGYRAVEAAGGFDDEADDTAVNLARELSDGEKLRIPYVFENASAENSDADAEDPGRSGGNGEEGGAGDEAGTGKININLASAEELTSLTGIGESKAEAIIAYRQEHGPFADIGEITRVSGIGSVIYGKIRDDICVE